MKKLISQILFILLLAVSIKAQTEEQKPVLLDEFGRLNLESTAARLDFFLSKLLETPSANGVIRIYGESENCFLCRYHFGSVINAYLKNTRKFSTEKYSIEYCDEKTDDLRVTLYLLPPGASLPKCGEAVEMPKNSASFGKVHFFYNSNKLSPLEDTYIDVVGPANGEYSVDVLKKVKNLLDKSPESKVYIIVYLGTNFEHGYYDKKKGFVEQEIRKLDKKSLAQKLIQNAKTEFIKNGIKSSQIETIEGGYVDDRRKLEFWFVPKGGEIPKPEPDYFPEKTRNKK